LGVLPLVIRELLAAHPYQYLYGSLSADITLAKRYVHFSRHCHNWTIGYEILDRATTPPLKAFALGYLSHLAADTIAHNVFVPRRLVATPYTRNVGHTYWEYRFDRAHDEQYLRLAREVVMMDHAEPDALLEQVLTQAIFSFQVNKRIFQQLIHLSNDERWHGLWVRMADKSRWELPEADVAQYGALSGAYVGDLLARGAAGAGYALDPTGRKRLALAKSLRRESFRTARRAAGREVALAPLAATRAGDASRFLATRPVSSADLERLAVECFPEPAPPRSADGLDTPVEAEAFWSEFSGGVAAR
ncbi:MAG: zinc dependent phospholipase C family protein, partial [Gemmatimonadota bacterium]